MKERMPKVFTLPFAIMLPILTQHPLQSLSNPNTHLQKKKRMKKKNLNSTGSQKKKLNECLMCPR